MDNPTAGLQPNPDKLMNGKNLIVVFCNVIFFIVVQTLFFKFIASKQFNVVLADKVGIINELAKQEGQVVGLGVPVKTALLTVFILIAFQTLFYFFGQKFRYPGTMGNEELLYEMQKNMVVNEDNLYKDFILSSLIKNKDVVKSMMSENNNYGQQQQQQQQEVEQTELELEDNVDQTEGSLISNLTGVANSVMDNIEDLGDELEIIKDTASNIKNNYMLL